MAPDFTISSLTIFSIFFSTLKPIGKKAYTPEATFLINADLRLNAWLGISASAGFSFKVGIKYLLNLKATSFI